ncbi:hypothetical protein CDAR_505222 [Caerostris darwini]|uniref:Uncharacterized protein n=1 Tax=Caerostris darwini TaxID=1538125 RepID=A0AAV4QY63_9ARAC|nr:hypothetical protein CDAR_505221 [Caerostris darwini]GIY14211.1 hypothetical protein CDAR_505222 [Caerostris darwini]
MVSLSEITFSLLSVFGCICLYFTGISGEESDMPAPKSDMDPIYQFYFAVISFLSAIADYIYYRLFGTPPE